MKAFVPIEPGWYTDKILHDTQEENLRADEFSNLIADASTPFDEIDMSDRESMFVHAYIFPSGVMCIDEYYEGKREDSYCIAFGPALRLTRLVEIFKIDWNLAPSWAIWATVNATGRVRWFSRKPIPLDLRWTMPPGGSAAYRAENDDTMQFSIPPHVDWRDLIEERPSRYVKA